MRGILTRDQPQQTETLKQSGGRSRFRMNPTQNSATCYSDNYDKEEAAAKFRSTTKVFTQSQCFGAA